MTHVDDGPRAYAYLCICAGRTKALFYACSCRCRYVVLLQYTAQIRHIDHKLACTVRIAYAHRTAFEVDPRIASEFPQQLGEVRPALGPGRAHGTPCVRMLVLRPQRRTRTAVTHGS